VKLFAVLMKHSRSVVLLSALAGVLGGVTNAGLFALINSQLTGKAAGSTVPRTIWIFVGLCLAVPITRLISSYFLVKLGQKTVFDLRMRLIRQILAAPLRRLEELGPHRLLTALTTDIGTVATATFALPSVCLNAALIAGCLVYLAWLSKSVFVMVFIFMVVGAISYRLPITVGDKFYARSREDADGLQKHFQAAINGTKELKVHDGRRSAYLDELRETGESFQRLNVASTTIYSGAASWGQLLSFVVIGLLLFLVPQFQHVDQQTLTGYTLVLLYMLSPIQVVMGDVPDLGRANVSIRKTEQLGISLLEEAPDTIERRIAPSWGSIELRGVTHSYYREDKDSSFVLGPISLSLRPGELVFLTGGNGSGKTTLAKLILGLYLPEEGGIWCDGERVSEENVGIYRQRFSAVFSDFFLFENLLGLGSPGLDDQALHYLQVLQLDKKVRVQEGRLSTTALSQGQRKRLALLTAYLEDRSIYLFDEWAADQDPLFKEMFYKELLPELKARGKTVVVISHDDHYYSCADRLIKLDSGRLEFDRAMPAA